MTIYGKPANRDILVAVLSLTKLVETLTAKVDEMGTTVGTELADIQAAVAGVAAAVTAQGADLTTIAAGIAALKNSTTSTLSPADQATLDSVDAAAKSAQTNAASVQAQADAMAGGFAPPVVTPPAGP